MILQNSRFIDRLVDVSDKAGRYSQTQIKAEKMSRKSLPVRTSEAFGDCGMTCGVSDFLAKEIRDALERARVVAVLDAFDPLWGMGRITPGGRSVVLVDTRAGRSRWFRGPTPDAARAAAAEAIEKGEV